MKIFREKKRSFSNENKLKKTHLEGKYLEELRKDLTNHQISLENYLEEMIRLFRSLPQEDCRVDQMEPG